MVETSAPPEPDTLTPWQRRHEANCEEAPPLGEAAGDVPPPDELQAVTAASNSAALPRSGLLAACSWWGHPVLVCVAARDGSHRQDSSLDRPSNQRQRFADGPATPPVSRRSRIDR
jgi:hypothetical protein